MKAMAPRRSSRWETWLWLGCSVSLLACSSDETSLGGGGGASSTSTHQGGQAGQGAAGGTDAGTDAAPPFTCTLPAATPSLEPAHWLHPAAPRAGQALTVVMQSGNTAPADAPDITAELIHRDGSYTNDHYTRVGGQWALYYVSVGGLAPGENCVVVRTGDNVELALKVDASDPTPGVARGNGVWKVDVNHQWTCAEQPTFGNLLHVRVLDEQGDPVQGAVVNIHWTDDTQYPVPPDDTAMSWDEHAHPKSGTTGADGRVELFTPWGEGIRTPIDAKPGLINFLLSVDGGASDVATEITTGLWETNNEGCNYCSTYAVNVYGHWSYSVEFRRDPTATEVCDVPMDHAGQQACAYTHFFHDPARPSCVPVAP